MLLPQVALNLRGAALQVPPSPLSLFPSYYLYLSLFSLPPLLSLDSARIRRQRPPLARPTRSASIRRI